MTIHDDGQGIAPEEIIQKAIEKQILTHEQAKTYSEDDVYQILLLSGFSTKDEVTQISGRGVGLDAVADQVKRVNGTLKINSMKGKFTEFQITIPL